MIRAKRRTTHTKLYEIPWPKCNSSSHRRSREKKAYMSLKAHGNKENHGVILRSLLHGRSRLRPYEQQLLAYLG